MSTLENLILLRNTGSVKREILPAYKIHIDAPISWSKDEGVAWYEPKGKPRDSGQMPGMELLLVCDPSVLPNRNFDALRPLMEKQAEQLIDAVNWWANEKVCLPIGKSTQWLTQKDIDFQTLQERYRGGLMSKAEEQKFNPCVMMTTRNVADFAGANIGESVALDEHHSIATIDSKLSPPSCVLMGSMNIQWFSESRVKTKLPSPESFLSLMFPVLGQHVQTPTGLYWAQYAYQGGVEYLLSMTKNTSAIQKVSPFMSLNGLKEMTKLLGEYEELQSIVKVPPVGEAAVCPTRQRF